jgi:UDP-GlcNAc:undecaprenyl-phosphate GlcNAc-1-phosphate transferase
MSYFIISAIICFGLTLTVRRIAIKRNILDHPDNGRKQHAAPVPLFGGLAIFIAFWLVVIWLTVFTGFNHKHLPIASLVGVFSGSLILLAAGLLDDKYKISPAWRLAATAIAAVSVIIGGTQFAAVTNPFGGMIPLDAIKIGGVAVLACAVVFFWLVGMTYTVKILDGLDGLATGIVLIGALTIHFLTASGKLYQGDITVISLVLAGVCAGFLVLNFHPAKIYLGESGGLFLGFILGVLAIIAGGKFATALLVLAIPILDLARVIYLRLKTGQPIFTGDRRHLHFKLIDFGLGHVQAVILLYFIAFAFGITTLFLQSKEKLIVLSLLTAGMIIFGIWLARREAKRGIL